ncbi:hypothetical protein HOF65_00190 [bacterium]|nr:hypothetical protein [bacterium]MBT6778347.1 hypothetical protein [bacterium]
MNSVQIPAITITINIARRVILVFGFFNSSHIFLFFICTSSIISFSSFLNSD